MVNGNGHSEEPRGETFIERFDSQPGTGVSG